jgi:hypothetical protein
MEVKHGFEFVGDNKPNSDLVRGKSNSGYNMGLREIIRYEALIPNSEKNLDPASSTDKLPSKQEYICDMCMQKFYNHNELQDHRKDLHLQQQESSSYKKKVNKEKDQFILLNCIIL